MAIDEAAYLRVGLGCIPADTKKEMMEQREDTTTAWRLPPKGERGTDSLSEGQKHAVGLPLSVSPRRGLEEWDWQPNPSSLARNQVFIRFGQVLEELEGFLANDQDFGHLLDELDALESFCEDEDIEFESLQERGFVKMKIGGAKKAAHRSFAKWQRGNPSANRRKNRQSKVWHQRHKSRDKMMGKTARHGFRREGIVSFTGRMESVDDGYDREHLRKLSGLTESKSEAFTTTAIMDLRRPTAQSIVDRREDLMLEDFRNLMGWR